MFEPANCAAVIACFNEAASIAALVPAVRRHVPHVFVVDDGSTDDTGRLARAAGAEVLRHERNLGKGAALETGLSRALACGYDWAVTLDGDGQHHPDDLPALFDCAQRTHASLVIGNRMDEAHKMSWLRRQTNRWMSRQLSRRAGRWLPDTQSGFRLIHLPTWAALPLQAERFEVESETLMAFLAAGHRVEFAPVRVNQSNRRSYIHPVRDSIRWLKWWRNSRRSARLRQPMPVSSFPAISAAAALRCFQWNRFRLPAIFLASDGATTNLRLAKAASAGRSGRTRTRGGVGKQKPATRP